MGFLRMRTRTVSYATLERECTWYGEITFFAHFVSRKNVKACFCLEAIPTSEAGGEGQEGWRFIRIPFAWYFRSNILNKQHLWNDLIAYRARYTSMLFN